MPGEVTGPVGKNIKNAYNFAKPGLKNLAGNTAKSEVVLKKAKLAGDTLKQIQNTEKGLPED